MLRRWTFGVAAVALLGVVVVGRVGAPADAQVVLSEEIDVHSFGEVALSFVSEPDIESLPDTDPLFGLMVTPVLVDGDNLYNPFKGPVTYNPNQANTASVSHRLGPVVNPGPRSIAIPYLADAMHGFAGLSHLELPGSMTLPPISPQGTSFTFDEFYDTVVDGMGLEPSGPTTLPNGSVVHVVRPTPSGQGTLTDQPVYMLGARTVEPRPFECPGVLRDSGLFFDTPIQNWDDTTGANSELFNDFFFAGDTALVTNCQEGAESQPPILRTFQGPGSSPAFGDAPSNGLLIAGPNGWIQIVYGGDIPGASGVRWFEFVTDLMAPYNPDYTAASAYPKDLTTLLPMSTLPHMFYDETLAAPETTTTASTTTTTQSSAAPPPVAADTTTTQAALAPPSTPASTSQRSPCAKLR